MPDRSALEEAWEVQHIASGVGFDWPDIGGAFDKVKEEIEELGEAIDAGNDGQTHEELGDLLFAVVNLSRFIGCHPETALTQATQKFQRRFDSVISVLKSENRTITDCSLEDLDAVWDRVKALESREKK